MMWTRVESIVWLAFLFVSICLGSAQAQTPAVDQKIEAKVMTDLGRTEYHWEGNHAAMSRSE